MDFGMLLSESFNERSRRASSLGFAYDASSSSFVDESAASDATILAACTEPLHQHPFALAQSPVAGIWEEARTVSHHDDVMENSRYSLNG